MEIQVCQRRFVCRFLGGRSIPWIRSVLLRGWQRPRRKFRPRCETGQVQATTADRRPGYFAIRRRSDRRTGRSMECETNKNLAVGTPQYECPWSPRGYHNNGKEYNYLWCCCELTEEKPPPYKCPSHTSWYWQPHTTAQPS